ncbi:hypothetical protein HN937_12095, partial [Candidatus Poribacteria bacterium]|nr:hypothetical protein [Candidatus Poribacteria bacterium]
GIGAASYEQLLREFGSAEETVGVNITALHSLPGISLSMAERIIALRDTLDPVRERWESLKGRRVVARLSDTPEYPGQLRKIPGAPPLLLTWGAEGMLPERSVAIVGTRNPCPEGLEAAATAARLAREDGWCVVSGLARGIDAAAHRGALAAAEDGEWASIAVVGHDLTSMYPPEHRRLAVEIGCAGAVASECLFGAVGARRLVRRNRIISGLCRGVMLIQSGQKDGALHTARFAERQRRDVAVWDPTELSVPSAGTAELVSRGRRHYNAANFADWLDHLGSRTEFPDPMLLFDKSERPARGYWLGARETVRAAGGCGAEAVVPDYRAVDSQGACGSPW